MRYKLAALTSHPIQYQAPLFRKLAACPDIDLMVYFCSNFGVADKFDPGFSLSFKWDIPLLEGYNYKFLNVSGIIIKELLRHRYDAIWIHGYYFLANWFGFLGAWMSKTPILLRGESHLLQKRMLAKRVLKKSLLGPLFKRISGFLAIGRLNKEYYLYYGVPSEKIFSVPYTADDDFFSQQKKIWQARQAEIKEALGIPDEGVVILYAGKLLGKKGALDLLKAFRGLENNTKAYLIFVGDGRQRRSLEEYVKIKSIKNVQFLGFKNQTELPGYYSIADILVLPSYDEPWGMVVNEAMYFDTAIIASDCVGAAYDLIQEGRNGFIYPAGDIESLTGLLKRLIENRPLLEELKASSGRLIHEWNLDCCVSGILTALHSVGKNKSILRITSG